MTNKKIAIMQPYILPYIGYFQLIKAVDEFVVYDNIKYTKKGWINRNRILVNNNAQYFTLPLAKDSDYLNISERFLNSEFQESNKKTLRKIEGSYKKSPYYNETIELLSEIFEFTNNNLFLFIHNSLKLICKHLDIKTQITISSNLNIDTQLKSEEKVIEICKELKATIYINPIGGIDLYNQNNFNKHKIELFFLKTNELQYNQFNNNFIPWLSIIDVLMFNGKENVKTYLENFKLIQ